MSGTDMSLAFEGFSHAISSGEAVSGPRVARRAGLRIALLAGETLRLPRARERVRVLSGRAWLSFDGQDVVLSRGESLELPRLRYSVLISALRGEALFFEVR